VQKKVIGRLNIALAFFSVVAINQIFPQLRRQIILICAANLAKYFIQRNIFKLKKRQQTDNK
jgi:hypothetical protein